MKKLGANFLVQGYVSTLDIKERLDSSNIIGTVLLIEILLQISKDILP